MKNTQLFTNRFLSLSLSGWLILSLMFACRTEEAHAQSWPRSEDVSTIDGIMRAGYEAISGPAGQAREWDRNRSLFMPGATVTSMWVNRRGERVVRRSVTLDERQENADWSSVGFFETEINREVHRYGPLAHVWSTYEYRLRQDGPVIGRGINSFQLFHDEGRWWIRSLAFFGESAEEPLPVVPAEYQTSVAELEGIWSIIGKPGQGEEYSGNVITRALERDVLTVRWEVGPDVFEGKGQLAGEGRILGRFTGAFDGFFELQVQEKGEMAAWWWSEDSQQWARESWERR